LNGDDQINIEAFDVLLREWIAQDRTRREIHNANFKRFFIILHPKMEEIVLVVGRMACTNKKSEPCAHPIFLHFKFPISI
jgi:hypothetical protein